MKTSKLLAYVFECAISDRMALYDAYSGEGKAAEEAKITATHFKNLKRVLLKEENHKTTPDQIHKRIAEHQKRKQPYSLAYLFDCAEREKASLYDAYNREGKMAEKEKKDLLKFKELRRKLGIKEQALYGPSALKRKIREDTKNGAARSVGLDELRKIHEAQKKPTPKGDELHYR